MIRKKAALLAALEGGETASLLRGMVGIDNNWRWVLTGTGEPIMKRAMGALLSDEDVQLSILQRDFCGDPTQYGLAEQA